MSPADLADLRRRNPKQQNSKNCNSLKQPVFLCVIMQPAAFLCVICVICGRIHIQTYSIYIHRRNPNISRWSRWFTQTNHKTTLTSPTCLSLRDNAACCIPLRDLRYLRENTRKLTQSISTNETPMSPADLADLRRQNPKQQNSNNPKTTILTNLSFSAI